MCSSSSLTRFDVQLEGIRERLTSKLYSAMSLWPSLDIYGGKSDD